MVANGHINHLLFSIIVAIVGVAVVFIQLAFHSLGSIHSFSLLFIVIFSKTPLNTVFKSSNLQSNFPFPSNILIKNQHFSNFLASQLPKFTLFKSAVS